MLKKILFCAEDYGSIKSLFPIYIHLKTKFNCRFYSNKNFFCEITKKKIKLHNEKEIIQKTKKFSPEVIFSGLGKNIDKKILQIYNNNNDVKKIVVFDEWYYNYKDVTKFRNKYLKINSYLVNDKICYNKALREGLDKKKIFITGQFHLSNIFYNFKKKKVNSNNILFLHEDIKIKKNIKNNNYPGYDTKQVISDLVSIHSDLNLNSKILIKKHPSTKENFDFLKKYFLSNRVKILKNNNVILKHMLSSKYIVGMRSMAILECIVLKLDAISYQPNSSHERCSAVNLGYIKSLKRYSSLKKILAGDANIYTKKNIKFNFIKKIQKINFNKIINN